MKHREQLVDHRGRRNVNRRTWNMIQAAENLAGFRFVITQGSYNTTVKQSAGTHDGGGVVDIRARDLNPRKRGIVVVSLRKVGFAAWLRNPDQGDWPWHIHAVARGDKDLSPGAAKQIRQYRNGLNGLEGGHHDDGPPGFYNMTWERFVELHRARARINPNDKRPRNSLGQLCLSYDAIQFAGLGRPMSGQWAMYRYSAHRSIKVLFPELRGRPDTSFKDSWLHLEKEIRRHPPNSVADPFSWYWFVGRCGFAPPDVNDWPARPRRRPR